MGRVRQAAAIVAVSAAVAAVAVVGLAPAGATGASGGDLPVQGTLTPSATTVAVGGSIEVAMDGCTDAAIGGSDTADPRAFLVVGTGASAVRAAIGEFVATDRYRLTVPGWVDPDEPAVVAGACDGVFFSHAPGRNVRRRFSFPDVAVDVTPAPAPVPYPTFSLQRTTFRSGQAVQITGSGCEPGDEVLVDLDPGTDLAWREGPTTSFGAVVPEVGDRARADGSFETRVVLNARGSDYQPGGPRVGGPLPVGPYVLRVGCGTPRPEPSGPQPEARPTTFAITGTNPTDAVQVELSDDVVRSLALSGEGCPDGRPVAITWRSDYWEGDTVGSTSTDPAPDGTWSATLDAPATREIRYLFATCGDPAGDGFAYVVRAFGGAATSDLVVDDLAPADEVPAGSDIAVQVSGRCDGAVDAVVYRPSDGQVLAASGAIRGYGGQQTHRLDLTVPTAAGDYQVAGRCRRAAGDGVPLRVTKVADGSATPAIPVSGTASYAG